MRRRTWRPVRPFSLLLLIVLLASLRGADARAGTRALPDDTIGPPERTLPVTFRDFNTGLPDVETLPCPRALLKGIVLPVLDSLRKPVRNPAGPCPAYQVENWFRDRPGNTRYCRTVTLQRFPGTSNYGFDDPHFFPLDDVGTERFLGKDGRPHNFHFSMEMHLTFKYRGGEVFSYVGDDEVFVFVNNRLAVDIGGNHGPSPDVLDLDAKAGELGLVPGNYYSFDLFFVERHTVTSYFKMATTIDFLPDPPGGVRIADGALNLLADTVTLYRGEPPSRFVSVRVRNREQDLECHRAAIQERVPVLSDWSLAGEPLGRDSVRRIDPAARPLGVYRLAAETGDSRDSLWVRIALPRVAAVKPSPRGGINCQDWKVKLATATEGARIYFTTGASPFPGEAAVAGSSWQRYQGQAIPLSGNLAILRAVAVKEGFSDSPILKETYLRDQVLAPVASPPGEPGTRFPVRVSLSSLTWEAGIRYRLLAEDELPGLAVPETSWRNYAAPFDLVKPGLVKAQAFRPGCRESEVMVEAYGMPEASQPIISPPGGEFWPVQKGIRLASSSPGADGALFYAIDSIREEEAHPVWRAWNGNSPGLSLGRSAIVRAIATRPGHRNSEAAVAWFERTALRGQGWYLDRDGDGRIESAVLSFNHSLPHPPVVRLRDPVSPASPWFSESTHIHLFPSGADGFGKVLSIRFPPFAPGTAFPIGAHAAVQADSIFPDLPVPMADSVGPVLVSAECRPPGEDGRPASLTLGFSEPVQGTGLQPFPHQVLRRGTFLENAVLASGEEAPAPAARIFRFRGDASFPCRGDSIRALPRSYLDALGNSALMSSWIPVTGERPSRRAEIGELRLAGNPFHLSRFQPSFGASVATLVDPRGEPVVEHPGNRSAALAPGPVFTLDVRYPVEHLSLVWHDHLGHFLGRAELAVSEADWRSIEAYGGKADGGGSGNGPEGESARLYIKWHPASRGQLLGTGVYLVQGLVRSRHGVVLGKDDVETDLAGTVRRIPPLRFGILRQ